MNMPDGQLWGPGTAPKILPLEADLVPPSGRDKALLAFPNHKATAATLTDLCRNSQQLPAALMSTPDGGFIKSHPPQGHSLSKENIGFCLEGSVERLSELCGCTFWPQITHRGAWQGLSDSKKTPEGNCCPHEIR